MDKVKNAKTKVKLVRKFHALLAQNGMGQDAKEALLIAYDVDSTKDLSVESLGRICEGLEQEPNKWRKRVMAAIGGWLGSQGRESNAQIIKAIACRASGYSYFNSIPVSRLRDIYNEFNKKQKVAKRSQVADLLAVCPN